MSPMRKLFGTLTVTFLAASSFATASVAGSMKVDVKIVSNNNRTFAIEVPQMTEVNCSNGAVDIVFGLVGAPNATFAEDASAAIRVVNGGGSFEHPKHDGSRAIIVKDLCTQMGEFKYDVGIIDPNGVFVLLDPVIKNY